MREGFILLAIGAVTVLFSRTAPNLVKNMIGGSMAERFRQYRPLVQKYMKLHGIDPAYEYVVYGLIEQESDWDPRAYRYEAHIQDASYGMMQILYSTAKGIGYTGTPEGLFDPETNINYGIKFLASQLKRYNGDIESAVEAYNKGSRLADGTTAYAQTVFRRAGEYVVLCADNPPGTTGTA